MSTLKTAAIAAIHLSPMHPDDLPTPISQKDSYLSSYPGEPVEPKPRRRVRLLSWNWERVEHILWAAVPPLFHVLSLVLLVAALLVESPSTSFMTVKERGGAGRLDYYILNSCAVTPGTTERICPSRSTMVNFVPSLAMISSSLPGLSAAKLPFFSHQTPSIFLSSVVLLLAALIIYIPLWTLVYFPSARLPGFLVRFYRYHARNLFYFSGILSFVSFILTVTIGVGYKLFLMGFASDFNTWYMFAIFETGSTTLDWSAEIGSAFDLVWAASTFTALTVISINIALHNGLDEKVEWPADEKASCPY
ncbi:hypothetical protein JCM21900_003894 [Sporobolomyces salmonicolor]